MVILLILLWDVTITEPVDLVCIYVAAGSAVFIHQLSKRRSQVCLPTNDIIWQMGIHYWAQSLQVVHLSGTTLVQDSSWNEQLNSSSSLVGPAQAPRWVQLIPEQICMVYSVWCVQQPLCGEVIPSGCDIFFSWYPCSHMEASPAGPVMHLLWTIMYMSLQNPFKKLKGSIQKVMFHPLRPFFFVAVSQYQHYVYWW